MTLPLQVGWQVFEKSSAGKQVDGALKAIAIVKEAVTWVEDATEGRLAQRFARTPSYLAANVDAANIADMISLVGKFHSLLNVFDTEQVDSGIITSGLKTVKSVQEAFKVVKERLDGLRKSEAIDSLVDFLETSAGDLDDALAQLTSVNRALTSLARLDTPATTPVTPPSATASQKLTADWMLGRDLLEYLPQALYYFKTNDDDDVAPNCKAYVTMASRFMQAVHAKEFVRQCPGARTCVSMDRQCMKLDRSCDRSCDSGCVIA